MVLILSKNFMVINVSSHEITVVFGTSSMLSGPGVLLQVLTQLLCAVGKAPLFPMGAKVLFPAGV